MEFAGVGKKHVTSVNELEDYFINGNRKRRFAYKKKRRSAQKSTGIFTLYLESCSKDSR